MNKKLNSTRYASESAVKQGGETFTPSNLADFVAQRILKASNNIPNKGIEILEPSVGDGELLLALLRHLKQQKIKNIQITAYDINKDSIAKAQERLSKEFPEVKATFIVDDFLSTYCKETNEDLFSPQKSKNKFDFVISNPPYVRTQILGAIKASDIAAKFNLAGRVDLYQPFLIAMTSCLKEGGALGVIVSNRFLTTKTGATTRKFLRENLELSEVWDLGDTKLFNAAVLPALIFGKKLSSKKSKSAPVFNSIYESKEPSNEKALDLFVALTTKNLTSFNCSNGKPYQISRGVLNFDSGNLEETWAISNAIQDEWLQTVKSNTAILFGDIAKIKVGVKTTADKVFLKKDWDELGQAKPELLYPLLTRKNACRYKQSGDSANTKSKEILYPYDLNSASRKPIDIAKFPKTKAYLESHREALEARTYVIEAGRKWFEIWVPHSPSSWAKKKLVFPDISEKPLFWLDTSGAIVSGECYWLLLEEGASEELLYLILAIANSSFIEKFYDTSFNNKLYSGKRRFISQYVEKFPLPNPELKISKEIIKLVKKLLAEKEPNKISGIEEKINALVLEAFGL